MKRTTFVILCSILALAALPERAQARKLIKDSEVTQDFRVPSVSEGEQKEEPVYKAPKRKRVVVEEPQEETHTYYKVADTGTEMRKIRRVGIGLQGAGALGMGGALLDLNFSPEWSFSAGYGGGGGFQSMELQAKYVLSGTWIMPYMNFGYARWSSVGQTDLHSKTNPSILGDRLLNDSEKAQGEFTKNLLYPGIGLQFTQLNGEWAGTSIYAEFVVLMDIGNFVAAPTGALGLLYYF